MVMEGKGAMVIEATPMEGTGVQLVMCRVLPRVEGLDEIIWFDVCCMCWYCTLVFSSAGSSALLFIVLLTPCQLLQYSSVASICKSCSYEGNINFVSTYV